MTRLLRAPGRYGIIAPERPDGPVGPELLGARSRRTVSWRAASLSAGLRREDVTVFEAGPTDHRLPGFAGDAFLRDA